MRAARATWCLCDGIMVKILVCVFCGGRVAGPMRARTHLPCLTLLPSLLPFPGPTFNLAAFPLRQQTNFFSHNILPPSLTHILHDTTTSSLLHLLPSHTLRNSITAYHTRILRINNVADTMRFLAIAGAAALFAIKAASADMTGGETHITTPCH